MDLQEYNNIVKVEPDNRYILFYRNNLNKFKFIFIPEDKSGTFGDKFPMTIPTEDEVIDWMTDEGLLPIQTQ